MKEKQKTKEKKKKQKNINKMRVSINNCITYTFVIGASIVMA